MSKVKNPPENVSGALLSAIYVHTYVRTYIRVNDMGTQCYDTSEGVPYAIAKRTPLC